MQIKGTMARFEGFLHKLLLISFLWALSNDVPLKIVENGCETFLVTDNQTAESVWCFLDFDRGLCNILTRWRRFHCGIRPGFMSSLLILGDIELNPGPNQQIKVALFNARSLMNKSASLEADVYSTITST